MAPSILGGTFVSVNASAIASYAKTGLERIVHFADKTCRHGSLDISKYFNVGNVCSAVCNTDKTCAD